MADERRFPMLPVRAWWALRRRFRAALPKEVSPTYVASALDMTPRSADTNVIPGLRQIGLLDEENRTTDLARRWRDDDEYSAVVESIRRTVYPQELLDLAPPGSADRTRVQNWFARHTGAGESAAGKMAAVYMLLCEADPTKQPEEGNSALATRPRTQPQRRGSADAHSESKEPRTPSVRQNQNLVPQVVFNIQVVLPSDATADTYDQIFRSISTHLLQGSSE